LSTARSEFGKANSATQLKSNHGNKDSKLDDSKTTPTKAAVMGDAMSEKAATPPNVTTTAKNSFKNTMAGMTATVDATLAKAPTAPNVTTIQLNTLSKHCDRIHCYEGFVVRGQEAQCCCGGFKDFFGRHCEG
jgi:hypothetical protein